MSYSLAGLRTLLAALFTGGASYRRFDWQTAEDEQHTAHTAEWDLAHDLQRPAAAVREAFDAFGSADKTFLRAGVADGFSVDYGHDDLLAGLAAPREVFPRIAAWLAERSVACTAGAEMHG